MSTILFHYWSTTLIQSPQCTPPMASEQKNKKNAKTTSTNPPTDANPSKQNKSSTQNKHVNKKRKSTETPNSQNKKIKLDNNLAWLTEEPSIEETISTTLKEESKPGCTLYIENLSFDTTNEQLSEKLSKYGKIISLKRPTFGEKSKYSGKPKGYAFVTFSKPNEAKMALISLDGVTLDGRKVKVSSYEGENVSIYSGLRKMMKTPEKRINRELKKVGNMATAIFVCNLPRSKTDEEVLEYFMTTGEERNVLFYQRASKQSTTDWAILEFERPEQAISAAKLNGTKWEDRVLKISLKKFKEKKQWKSEKKKKKQ